MSEVARPAARVRPRGTLLQICSVSLGLSASRRAVPHADLLNGAVSLCDLLPSSSPSGARHPNAMVCVSDLPPASRFSPNICSDAGSVRET